MPTMLAQLGGGGIGRNGGNVQLQRLGKHTHRHDYRWRRMKFER